MSPKALAMAVVAGVRGNSSIHGLGAVGQSGGGPVALLGSSHVPRGFLQRVLKPLCPFDLKWSMALVVVPGAHPNDVLGCCWYST